MPYRFKLDEPLQTGLRRILSGQIQLALGQLRDEADRAKAVHETRKAMKRGRALLKLVRPGLDDKVYRAFNDKLGAAGRVLSASRDYVVLAATAHRLGDRAGKKTRGAVETLVRQAAPSPSECGASAAQRETEATAQAIAMLEEVEASLPSLRLRSGSFGILRTGLKNNYRKGQRSMRIAYRENEDEGFHNWRKAVQAHWRQMLLLSTAWPDLFDARAKVAKELSELLGEDHDLAVLVERAAEQARGKKKAGTRSLIARAKERQREIRQHAHAKGEVLYAEDASDFAEHVESYWVAAEEEARLGNGADAGAGEKKAKRKAAARKAGRGAATASALRGANSAKDRGATRKTSARGSSQPAPDKNPRSR